MDYRHAKEILLNGILETIIGRKDLKTATNKILLVNDRAEVAFGPQSR